MIYGIKAGRAIKLGYAIDPKKRLKELQTGNHEHMELVFTAPGTKEDEVRLHKRFDAHRIHGEWFEDCDALRSYLDLPYARKSPSAHDGLMSNSTSLRCPWCGSEKVLLCLGDVAQDERRIDFYCDNHDGSCNIKTFSVLATCDYRERLGVSASDRADVQALERIDMGTDEEYEQETGDTIERLGGFRVIRFCSDKKDDEHHRGIVRRREGATA